MMVSTADILNANLLIVDDQESNVRLLEQLLSDAGYARVATTMNPQEVCALHRKNRYDLILLDLQMPGMDGFQVMEGLRALDAAFETAQRRGAAGAKSLLAYRRTLSSSRPQPDEIARFYMRADWTPQDPRLRACRGSRAEIAEIISGVRNLIIFKCSKMN